MAYREELWQEAKKKCRLSEEEVKIAKTLGLNPKSLIKNIPAKNELWKAPVGEWIREIQAERQEKSRKKKLKEAAQEKKNADTKKPVGEEGNP